MSPLEEAVKAAKIQATWLYLGRRSHPRKEGDPRLDHEWRCSLRYGDVRESFQFFTGSLKTYPSGGFISPSISDLLSCLLSDYGACEVAFAEWCSELGYDEDSRKALNTYLTCQANGIRVRKLLGRELFEQLRGLEH